MVTPIGHVPVNSTVRLPFNTITGAGAAVTFTGTVANVNVYKDGGTTKRSSTSGMTLSKDYGSPSVVGCHSLAIDLSDNTDAGFWADGSTYTVLLSAVTIDSQTVSCWIGTFVIGSQYQFKKNTALSAFTFPMYNSVGTLLTGLTVTAQISKDGAALTNTANSVVEIGGGLYKVDLTAASTNATVIGFVATAPGAKPTCMTFLPQA